MAAPVRGLPSCPDGPVPLPGRILVLLTSYYFWCVCLLAVKVAALRILVKDVPL